MYHLKSAKKKCWVAIAEDCAYILLVNTTNAPQVMHQNGSGMLLNGMELLLKLSRCILLGQLCNRHARVETDGRLNRSNTPSRLNGETEQTEPIA